MAGFVDSAAHQVATMDEKYWWECNSILPLGCNCICTSCYLPSTDVLRQYLFRRAHIGQAYVKCERPPLDWRLYRRSRIHLAFRHRNSLQRYE